MKLYVVIARLPLEFLTFLQYLHSTVITTRVELQFGLGIEHVFSAEDCPFGNSAKDSACAKYCYKPTDLGALYSAAITCLLQNSGAHSSAVTTCCWLLSNTRVRCSAATTFHYLPVSAPLDQRPPKAFNNLLPPPRVHREDANGGFMASGGQCGWMTGPSTLG